MTKLQRLDPFWKGVATWAAVAVVVNPFIAMFFGALVYSLAERAKPVD